MSSTPPSNRRRRRLLAEVAVFLTAGTLITVGGAWLIAARVSTQSVFGQSVFEPSPQIPDPVAYGWTGPLTLNWPLRVPRSWPNPKLVNWSHGFGMLWLHGTCEAYVEPVPPVIRGAVGLRAGWPMYALEWHEAATIETQYGVGVRVTEVFTARCARGILLPASYGTIFPGGVRAGTNERRLPTIPLIPGLVVDAALSGMILWALTLGPFRLRRSLIIARRRRLGRCVACGYPAGAGGVCSECGRPLSA
jgi:hypothetical protein